MADSGSSCSFEEEVDNLFEGLGLSESEETEGSVQAGWQFEPHGKGQQVQDSSSDDEEGASSTRLGNTDW
jgi:hypothetical protein